MFFELLQVALGNRERLSRVPTVEEWEEIYDEFERQAVTGVLLVGIDKLPLEQRPPKMMLLQWIGEGQMIEQRNKEMDEHCLKLLKMLDDYGLRGSILKGQGVALLYDDEIRPLRQSGDIDVYVDCGLKGAVAFAKSHGLEKVKWDYKHLHLNIWDDIAIEMHYRVEVLLNLWMNKMLQVWFKDHEDAVFNLNDNLTFNSNTDGADRMTTPAVEFNVFYILLHIYRHFLYEGVGFRQVIDYYFVLKQLRVERLELRDSSMLKESLDAVREFGIMKFAKGLMWVMRETLGMPEGWMLWEPDKKEGVFILKQVMLGGNFGHYDERLKHGGGKLGSVIAILTHNIHLLTHYPADTLWAPVWFVWHKLWKIKTRAFYEVR